MFISCILIVKRFLKTHAFQGLTGYPMLKTDFAMAAVLFEDIGR